MEVFWSRRWLCNVTRQRSFLRACRDHPEETLRNRSHDLASAWMTWLCAAPLCEVQTCLQHILALPKPADDAAKGLQPTASRSACIELGRESLAKLSSDEMHAERLVTDAPPTSQQTLGFEILLRWNRARRVATGSASATTLSASASAVAAASYEVVMPLATCIVERKTSVGRCEAIPFPSHWEFIATPTTAAATATAATATSIHRCSRRDQVTSSPLARSQPEQPSQQGPPGLNVFCIRPRFIPATHFIGPQASSLYQLVQLPDTHAVYKTCATAFLNSLDEVVYNGSLPINRSYSRRQVCITRILQIQRGEAWRDFTQHRAAMQAMFDPTETCSIEGFPMFHGTPWHALDSICRHGLQPGLGLHPSNGERLGRGNYTTQVGGLALHYAEKSASTSDDTEFAVLACRVLRGNWKTATPFQRDPLLLPVGIDHHTSGARVHSTVDHGTRRKQCCVPNPRQVYAEVIVCCKIVSA